MPVRSPGLSGTAVAAAAAGGLLIVSGMRNVPVLDTLRSLIQGGGLPDSRDDTHTLGRLLGPLDRVTLAGEAGVPTSAKLGTIPSAAGGAKVAAAAARYEGVPYRWGGADPSGFDCSGLVTWVLHHDLGIDLSMWRALGLPCSNSHTVSGQFLVADGLVTIPRDQTSPGDLVCWTGHVGIAISRDRMIAAPHAGVPVRESAIWSQPPPTIRRLKGV